MLIKKHDSEEFHQHVAGFINAEGTLISGEGIKNVTNLGPGLYKIEFETPFKEKPAVVATLFNKTKDLSIHAVITYEIETNYVCILTGDADAGNPTPPAGKPENSSFSFIAFGDAG